MCDITGTLAADLQLMIADSNWNSGEMNLSESMIARGPESLNKRIHEMSLFMGMKNQYWISLENLQKVTAWVT